MNNLQKRIFTSFILSAVLLICIFLNKHSFFILVIIASVISFFELNNLVKKEIKIGTIKILPYELCKPCLHLEQMVNGKDIIKEFLRRGGLRCEVLVSGKIKIGDKIRIL